MKFKYLKIGVISICSAASGMTLTARVITPDEARVSGAKFFEQIGCERLADVNHLKLLRSALNSAGKPMHYVFGSTDSKGFIIVAADDEKQRIIGYSDRGAYDVGNVPSALGSVLSTLPDVKPVSSSGRLKAARANAKRELATAEWSQESPFNDGVPGRRLTGCVATAMASIMKYHAFPQQGRGAAQGVTFGDTYQWNSMRADNYRKGYSQAEGAAVAQLMRDVAASILTDFGQSSSSAFEVRVPSALINHFGYDAGVSYKKRSELDKESWESIIIGEIESNRPVLYCGQDVASGHAFVCDGYQQSAAGTFFHINWGWGGSANGYFASDALNPTVSKTHHYNDQMTIVYNIKPSASSLTWSGIHLTSDNNQPGLTIDTNALEVGKTFSLRAGSLKNIENSDFRGQIVAALFSASGTMKRELSSPKGFNLVSLQTEKYIDFTCQVPADANIEDGDVVRLATRAEGSQTWLPVAGELIVYSEASARGYQIPYYSITMPNSINGAELVASELKVIKGRDYLFTVRSTSPQNVITVKANGFILTPNSQNEYRISNVTSDQQINILVQNAADVVSRKVLYVNSGELSSKLTEEEMGTVKDLTLFGTINASDFSFIRDKMKLNRLDISGVSITSSGSNPANAIPANAFNEYRSLQEIILPSNLTALKLACFRYTGLKKIEIPASVSSYEYNLFVGCGALTEVTVRRSSPAWINWCVFSGVPKSKLIVPVGARSAYASKENWKDFKVIEEQNPVAATAYTVTLQDVKGVRIIPTAESNEVAPGAKYSFRVETDGTEGDATQEVYAGKQRLIADEQGLYTVTVNSNTLIHTLFKQPTAATSQPSMWKLTDAEGGIGLATDVINVVKGRVFTVRANAIAIPSGSAAALYYAAVLTDGKGGIKEVISPIVGNNSLNFGNRTENFTCQVKEASVKEGNTVMIATSLDKKVWSLVNGANNNIADRISAIGNKVTYHAVNMPQRVEGATIQGAVTEVAHGMPFTLRIIPVAADEGITMTVNGTSVAVGQSLVNYTLPAVKEDLNISIQVGPKNAEAYTIVNVAPGQLASKIANAPKRLKVTGTMYFEDFDAIRAKSTIIQYLDLSDVTIKGAVDKNKTLPSRAFVPSDNVSNAALLEVMLPSDLTGIEAGAFDKCTQITQLTIPKDVSYIGADAFKGMTSLAKIIARPALAPKLLANPFPAQVNDINLEVGNASWGSYSNATFWSRMTVDGMTTYIAEVDMGRVFAYGVEDQLTKIVPSNNSTKTVSLGFPNMTRADNARNIVRRPGIPFRVFVDGIDVIPILNGNINDMTSQSGMFSEKAKFCNGQYLLAYNPRQDDPLKIDFPRNHKVDVVFHYDLSVQTPAGITAKFENLAESDVWDAPMVYFDYPRTYRVYNKTVYREGKDYSFSLGNVPEGMEFHVKATSEVITSPGTPKQDPVKENREKVLVADENGVYTVANLQGNTKVVVSLLPMEGTPMTSEQLQAVEKEAAKDVENIALSGNLTDAAMKTIRENFTSVKSLDLSGVQNSKLPDNAFSNMKNLNSVAVPENITELGKNAFGGCGNLESLTLNGVTKIGDGAFNGCDQLTSIQLNASSGTATRAGSSISLNSFSGANPNMLLMLADKTLANQLAEESKNSNTSHLNVIYSGEGERRALTEIAIDGSKSFNVPIDFKMSKLGASCVMAVNAAYKDVNSGWRGLVLPFKPTKVSVVNKDASAVSKVEFYSFDDEGAEELTKQSEVEANRPYLMQYTDKTSGSYNVKFDLVPAGTDTVVMQQTPVADELCRRGCNFTLYATYETKLAAEGDYLLNSGGTIFQKVSNVAIGSQIAPFGVILKANSDGMPSELVISRKSANSGLDEVGISDGLKVIVEDGQLVIYTNVSRMIEVYDISGRVVAREYMQTGRNTLHLVQGVYIVAGRKVIL